MKLGVALPVAGAWGTPDNVIRIAQRAEALGYRSLWVFQRLLYALVPKTTTLRCRGSPGREHSSACWTPSSHSHM